MMHVRVLEIGHLVSNSLHVLFQLLVPPFREILFGRMVILKGNGTRRQARDEVHDSTAIGGSPARPVLRTKCIHGHGVLLGRPLSWTANTISLGASFAAALGAIRQNLVRMIWIHFGEVIRLTYGFAHFMKKLFQLLYLLFITFSV